MFHKEKKKKEEFDAEEEEFLKRFEGIETPVLTLDENWLRVFPDGYKTPKIRQLEIQIREEFMRQARLGSEIDGAEKQKKQLMDRIIRFMRVAQVDAKEAKNQEKSQEYIRDINAQLSDLEQEYEQVPEEIKSLNQELLKESLRVCYQRMRKNKDAIEAEKESIIEVQEILKEHKDRKKELCKENERIFMFMHRVFGRRIIELFDEFDEIEETDEIEGEE